MLRQLGLWKCDQPLTAEERRHLGAYKLFLESVDPSYIEVNTKLDNCSPRGLREIIKAYHLWLDDPGAIKWCLKLGDWIYPFDWLRYDVARMLSRLIPLD